MEISKLPLNIQASKVITEVNNFIFTFERLKSRKPIQVAIRKDKFLQVERAVIAQLRRQTENKAAAKDIKAPEEIKINGFLIYPYAA